MTQQARRAWVHRGLLLEELTLVWMALEAALSVGAGIAAGSLLLTAFGLDSAVELVSGAIVFWRLRLEARGGDTSRVDLAERRAARVVGVLLALLCLYVLASAVYGFASQNQPEASPLGIAVAVSAVILMPALAAAKKWVAGAIDSRSLRADAASSVTCAYMAATVLAGLALNAVFGWWWAEPAAALVFLVWLVQETREAFEEAGGSEDPD